MKTGRILYISYDGMTDPLGQSQVLPYLVGLSAAGHHITLLSTEKRAAYNQRKDLIKKITADAGIDWQPIFYTKRPPVLSTLYDLWRLKQKAFYLHKIKKFDAIHCRSYVSALVGEAFKEKYQDKIKFIFDMRGFWADERVEGGLWNTKKYVFKKIYDFFKKKEKKFLQSADYTISLTTAAKQEIESWQLSPQSPIQVIPCCVDVDLFDLNKLDSKIKSTIIENKNTAGKFVVNYLGSLGTWYLSDDMLRFFKRLLLYKPYATFLFITPDSPDIIKEAAEKHGIPLQNIRITAAERREVPALLAQSHISLFFVKPSYSKKASSPTKMGEILAMGIPIIANTGVGDNEYLFQKYHCGALLENFYPRTFDQIIMQLDEVLKISPKYLRNVATEYFDLDKGINLYNEVYQKILN